MLHLFSLILLNKNRKRFAGHEMLRCSDKQNLWSMLTINNIGIVPELGICAKRGLKKVQTKKHMPQTKVASPVFAPSFNPTPVSGERIIGGPKNRNKSLGEDVIDV